ASSGPGVDAEGRGGERRRRYRRGKVRLMVRVKLVSENEGLVLASTRNLSWGGVFVQSARVFPVGSPVKLSFQLPGEEASAQGVVRWGKRVPVALLGATIGGIGIKFTELSPRFRSFLAEALGPPED
ncbi:MAG: hypothetical protein HGA98_00395, partial [Deltaproteobacteria bacterium]|nr:hypothetical protein [Deltaproteobacteria bacterium]